MRKVASIPGIALACFVLAGVIGCQEDNNKTANIVSGQSPPGVKLPTNEERMKAAMGNAGQKAQKSNLKQMGYPGMR